MKKSIITMMLALLPTVSFASGDTVHLDRSEEHTSELQSH